MFALIRIQVRVVVGLADDAAPSHYKHPVRHY